MRDVEAAFKACAMLLEIEPHYVLTLRTAPLLPADEDTRQPAFVIAAKYPGKCTACGGRFDAGAAIAYNRATRTARHEACA